jgi:non-lysosomal glucosylceramidase
MEILPNLPTAAAWKRRFDAPAGFSGSEMKLNPGALVKMLPFLLRMGSAIRKERQMGIVPALDMRRGLKIEPVRGVPLGGLGGGTIGRGWRGDFNRWQMRPGLFQNERVAADGFSLWVQRPGEPPSATVLFPDPPAGDCLRDWNWGLDPARATYYALFPRAWTVYEQPAPGITLTCRQVSPVIPHNYTESSLPAGVFVWDIENTGPSGAEVALMFTFQNGTGSAGDLQGGHANRLYRQPTPGGEIVGIELKHLHRQPKPFRPGQKSSEREWFEDPLAFSIAVLAPEEVEASYLTRFITNSDGLNVWGDFAEDGRLVNSENESPSSPGFSIGAALSARVHVPAGGKRRVVFGLAWDMPLARFSLGSAWYRRYTRFYGRDGQAASRILREALLNYPRWEAQIEAWQRPVLEDPDLPDWYKGMLFNETYYLVEGGTIWTDGKEVTRTASPSDDLPEGEYGHFATLEGHEYRYYNTYDVHFYASFALAMLWPELELSVQRDFARALRLENLEPITCLASGVKMPRKARGAIPHDLGSTTDPWQRINDYCVQDTSRWKDLNPKFVLQVYRDWVLTGDRQFLREVWEAVKEAVAFVRQFDADGDGLIENGGYPDQTYDMWTAQGPGAYCGGLWLACLSAAAALAEEMGEKDLAGEYRALLGKAQPAYEKLWNGSYYDYDSSRKAHHNSLMADQGAGQWYARACGLEGELRSHVIPEEHARQALQTIFDCNVMAYGGGELGAINGMRPAGKIDRSSMQSQEVWTGTTFALAAAMLQEGLLEQAFTTARGIYTCVYEDFGLWFQTPEAISADGTVRAIAYMRPLAIWAMQWAWERRKTGLG